MSFLSSIRSFFSFLSSSGPVIPPHTHSCCDEFVLPGSGSGSSVETLPGGFTQEADDPSFFTAEIMPIRADETESHLIQRQLASIQVIKALHPIDGADSIECAEILGWFVVVKKGEFQVGDKCIYCEIDSILPEREEFEFLRSKKFRIRTAKMRGQISQGIAFPLAIANKLFEEERRKIHADLDISSPFEDSITFWNPDIDLDVTEFFGIKKYESEGEGQGDGHSSRVGGKAKGNFPSFLKKTDEIRVQILESVVQRHQGTTFFITEKLDGSSCTFFMKDGVFGVCSRNLELQEDDNNRMWEYARCNNVEEKLRSVGKNISVQGEIIGKGIQGNKYKIEDTDFYVFNVFDIDKHATDKNGFYEFPDFIEFCDKYGFKYVPIIDNDFELTVGVKELVEMSKANSVLNPAVPREGIVFRPWEETYDYKLGRLSFKSINPEFLLKYGH